LKVFLALSVSILIVFGSPYVGQLREWLQATFPDYYRWIIGAVVAVSAAVAIAGAVVRLRRYQSAATAAEPESLSVRARYALIAVALAAGAGYGRAVRTDDPAVDMVEAFHFVEYGLVAYVFYRAWRRRPDVSGVLLALCAGVAVGVADEWVQWFVPGRVGEVHDVGLNAAAVACGVIFSIAVHPPLSLALPRRRASRIALGAAVSGLIVAVAGFVDRVHIGHEVDDGQTAVFRSRYDAQELTAAASNRAVRWQESPPPAGGFSREDHYLSEGGWHVGRRNTAVGVGDLRTALGENAILERFYGPVLDRLGRWSIEQRTEAETLPGRARARYVSDAVPYPIYVVPRSLFWLVTLAISAAIIAISALARSSAAPAGV
jgi:VanZ family protein